MATHSERAKPTTRPERTPWRRSQRQGRGFQATPSRPAPCPSPLTRVLQAGRNIPKTKAPSRGPLMTPMTVKDPCESRRGRAEGRAIPGLGSPPGSKTRGLGHPLLSPGPSPPPPTSPRSGKRPLQSCPLRASVQRGRCPTPGGGGTGGGAQLTWRTPPPSSEDRAATVRQAEP